MTRHAKILTFADAGSGLLDIAADAARPRRPWPPKLRPHESRRRPRLIDTRNVPLRATDDPRATHLTVAIVERRANSDAWQARALPLVYGFLVCLAVTLAATWLKAGLQLKLLSPLVLSFLVGVLAAQVATLPKTLAQGVAGAGKLLLRLGVAILGAQISVQAVAGLGLSGLALALTATVSTLMFTIWAGRRLGVERNLVLLLASGTSICGASAIVATSESLKSRREDAGYALVCITVFGTLSMLAYPAIYPWLGLSEVAFGAWSGASLHEMAQVVGAAFSVGPEAGATATLEKLTRVLLLGPVIIALQLLTRDDKAAGMAAGTSNGTQKSRPQMKLAAAVPTYVAAFLVLVALNSADLLPGFATETSRQITPWLLACGLAAIGLQTKVGAIIERGLRPLLLAGLATVFISLSTLALTAVLFN